MQVYIGIDWSETKHDVVFMNEQGVGLAQLVIPHSIAGFSQFDATRRKLGLAVRDCLIGLETAHNLVIDYLWSRDYPQIYVVPPNVVNSNRGRYRQSGARDDPGDAFVLADLLRTDRSRLQPWHPDSLLTRQLRAKVSLSLHLGKQVTRLANRLRAVLLRYYPAAVQVFKGGLTTQIAPAFVRAYPTPAQAAQLSWAEFVAFARQQHYPQPKRLAACFARLQADIYPTACPETVHIFSPEAVQLAELLLQSVQAKLALQRDLRALFQQHPDAPLFASLPGTGDFLGPALLAKFGDDRQRFPQPSSVQALAGTCPVTKKSGQWKSIRFRRACDREWRQIGQTWARALVAKGGSPLAGAYFQQVRPHCRSNSHAYRCLANRWLAVAWKVWHSRQIYDEGYHFQQRALRAKPQRHP